ncbi:MAG: hypothetical protein IJO32_03055 [Bacilli bacterium]|nr:hypothetical protein [Bacilli bacterium]
MKNELIDDEEEKRKKGILLIILYIISILLFIISSAFTFSVFINSEDRDKIYNEVRVGEVAMEFLDRKETNIRLFNTYPMSDKEALKLDPFEFRVTNTGTLPLIYRLKLEEVPDNELKEIYGLERLPHNKVKYALIDKKTHKILKKGKINEISEGILLTEKLLPRYSKEFQFRLWIDEKAGNEVQNKYYVGKIVLEVNDILDD